MNEQRISAALVDYESGAILDYAYENEGYKKYNIDNLENQRQFLQENKTNFLKDSTFVKTFDATERYIREILTEPEYQLAMKLSHYAGYNDGILRKYTKSDSITLTLKDMAVVTNNTYDHVRKTVKKLIDKDIMGKARYIDFYPDFNGKDRTIYFMNPYIFFRGTNVRKKLLEYFDYTFWQKIHDDFNS